MYNEQELPSLPGEEEEEIYYVDDDGMEVKPESWSKGKNSSREQGSNIPVGFKPTARNPLPVVRCTAVIRNGERKGERCSRWSIRGATVCLVHGGTIPNVKKAAEAKVEAARMRIIGDSELAVDTLFDLLKVGTADNVRLGAAKDILDRAGLKPGEKVDIDLTIGQEKPSEMIMKKLKTMGKKEIDNVEEAVVLDENE